MRLRRDRLKLTTTLRETLSAQRDALWASPTDAAFRGDRLKLTTTLRETLSA